MANQRLLSARLRFSPQLSNPNPSRSVVLAGTGETDSSGDSYYGLGILRSADAGQTWTLITQDVTGIYSFAGLGFSHIAFSTASPNQVVAAAASASEGILEGLENPLTANRGLYHSTDAGLSWSRANISDAGVTIAPASVTSVVYNSAAGLFYAAVRFHGIYSSPDGSNWARLSFQPGVGLNAAVCPAQAVLPSGCPIYRGEIAVVTSPPTQPTRDEMYVWYVDANNADQGIWKSVNGGGSWNQLNDSGITNCGDFFGGCGTAQGSYNLALAAVPNGSATDLYAGATNLYKCTITNAIVLSIANPGKPNLPRSERGDDFKHTARDIPDFNQRFQPWRAGQDPNSEPDGGRITRLQPEYCEPIAHCCSELSRDFQREPHRRKWVQQCSRTELRCGRASELRGESDKRSSV